jgi:hypothetical protein
VLQKNSPSASNPSQKTPSGWKQQALLFTMRHAMVNGVYRRHAAESDPEPARSKSARWKISISRDPGG